MNKQNKGVVQTAVFNVILSLITDNSGSVECATMGLIDATCKTLECTPVNEIEIKGEKTNITFTRIYNYARHGFNFKVECNAYSGETIFIKLNV